MAAAESHTQPINTWEAGPIGPAVTGALLAFGGVFWAAVVVVVLYAVMLPILAIIKPVATGEGYEGYEKEKDPTFMEGIRYLWTKPGCKRPCPN